MKVMRTVTIGAHGRVDQAFFEKRLSMDTFGIGFDRRALREPELGHLRHILMATGAGLGDIQPVNG